MVLFMFLSIRKYIAEPSKITISSMDEKLLNKAMNYIEENISNND